MLIIVIGFLITLVLAWASELTPEGIKRTEDVDPAIAGPEEREEPSGEIVVRLIRIRLTASSLEKIWPACQAKKPQPRIAASSSTKRGQLFIRVNNKTFFVPVMRVSNEDRSPVEIHS